MGKKKEELDLNRFKKVAKKTLKDDIDIILGRSLMSSISSQVRLDIIDILVAVGDEGLKITDIKKILEKIHSRSYDIKTVMFHLLSLKESNLIISEKQQKKKGRPVIVKLNKKKFPIYLLMGKKKYKIL